MSEENAHKLWEERAHRQFEPLFTASGKGIDTDAALRMAHAFETSRLNSVKSIGS